MDTWARQLKGTRETGASSATDAAPQAETTEMFDRDHMIALEDFGREMGADPLSCKTEIPSPYWSR